MISLASHRLPPMEPDTRRRVELICRSYRHWIGHDLLATSRSHAVLLRDLYFADFVLLAHGNEPDPLLNFCNAAALQLWDYEWAAFLNMPSRLTAEPDRQKERARVLADVKTHGYSTNYSGIRISRTGKRFQIRNAIVWNVLDEADAQVGQAAMFRDWTYLAN